MFYVFVVFLSLRNFQITYSYGRMKNETLSVFFLQANLNPLQDHPAYSAVKYVPSVFG